MGSFGNSACCALNLFDFLDRPAVVEFGLGLIAQEQGPSVGLPSRTVETFAQRVVAILGAGDFDIAAADESSRVRHLAVRITFAS